jgi:hypothetical protein
MYRDILELRRFLRGSLRVEYRSFVLVRQTSKEVAVLLVVCGRGDY